MNRVRLFARLSVLGVATAAVLVAASPQPVAHQGSTGVEEIIALNNKYRPVDLKVRRLATAPDFVLIVEDMPDELSGVVQKSDLEKWIKDELARSAPDAQIIGDTEQEERLKKPNGNPADAPNLEGYIKRRDAAARFLYVRLSFMKAGDVSFYDISVEFNRIGVMSTGAGYCTVFSTGGYGSYGPQSPATERLKTAVSAQVKKFGTAWTAANAAE